MTTLISDIVTKAIAEGLISELPDKITLVTHFGRGDLAACRDFPVLKEQLDALKNVLTSAGKPAKLILDIDPKSGLPALALPRMPNKRVMSLPGDTGNRREVRVTLRDTSLLSAEGCKSLDAIGTLVGVPKVNLPEGHDKAHMSRFFERHRNLAERYLLADLEITAKYYMMLAGLFRDIGIGSVPPTLGAAAVRIFEKSLRGLKDADGNVVTPETLFGTEKKVERRYSRDTGRFYNMKTDEMSVERAMFEEFMARAYAGGRTETYVTGPTPPDLTLYDIDLQSAYPSAMVGIRVPDYGRAFLTTGLADFRADVLGAA